MKVCQNEQTMEPVLMARSEALNVGSGRRGRIPQTVESCSPQIVLGETARKHGVEARLSKPGCSAMTRRVIIRITRRIMVLPLFSKLTNLRTMWPLQVLDRVRDPAPEAASANS